MIWEKRNKLSDHELCGKQFGSMIYHNWFLDGILPAGAGVDDVRPIFLTCLVQKAGTPFRFRFCTRPFTTFPTNDYNYPTLMSGFQVEPRGNPVYPLYSKIATSFSL